MSMLNGQQQRYLVRPENGETPLWPTSRGVTDQATTPITGPCVSPPKLETAQLAPPGVTTSYDAPYIISDASRSSTPSQNEIQINDQWMFVCHGWDVHILYTNFSFNEELFNHYQYSAYEVLFSCEEYYAVISSEYIMDCCLCPLLSS